MYTNRHTLCENNRAQGPDDGRISLSTSSGSKLNNGMFPHIAMQEHTVKEYSTWKIQGIGFLGNEACQCPTLPDAQPGFRVSGLGFRQTLILGFRPLRNFGFAQIVWPLLTLRTRSE